MIKTQLTRKYDIMEGRKRIKKGAVYYLMIYARKSRNTMVCSHGDNKGHRCLEFMQKVARCTK